MTASHRLPRPDPPSPLRPERTDASTEDGSVGIAFDQQEPGVYEAHTAALPDARGSRVLAAVRPMIAFMFTATDYMELLNRFPVNNRAADAPARAVGGTLDFERAAAWPTDKGPVAEDLSVSRDAGIAFWGDLKDGPRLAVAIDRDEDGIGVVRDDFNVGADGQGVRHRSGSGVGSWRLVAWRREWVLFRRRSGTWGGISERCGRGWCGQPAKWP
jgi:hypothetical protein